MRAIIIGMFLFAACGDDSGGGAADGGPRDAAAVDGAHADAAAPACSVAGTWTVTLTGHAGQDCGAGTTTFKITQIGPDLSVLIGNNTQATDGRLEGYVMTVGHTPPETSMGPYFVTYSFQLDATCTHSVAGSWAEFEQCYGTAVLTR
jgi:hypothetical protein